MSTINIIALKLVITGLVIGVKAAKERGGCREIVRGYIPFVKFDGVIVFPHLFVFVDSEICGLDRIPLHICVDRDRPVNHKKFFNPFPSCSV